MPSSASRQLVWFRADLRTADNAALHHACQSAAGGSGGVVGLFILCARQWRDRHDMADIRAAFVLRHLRQLSLDLHALNIPLVIRACEWFKDVPELVVNVAQQTGCEAVHAGEECELNERLRDDAVAAACDAVGLRFRCYTDNTLSAPGSIVTQQGRSFTVFTPFRKAWTRAAMEQGIPAVLPTPPRQARTGIASDPVPDVLPPFDLSHDRADLWPAGERHALARMQRFAAHRLHDYKNLRDHPGINGTSTLSPYLAVGSISPRQCLALAVDHGGGLANPSPGAEQWISELLWREFYKHILVAFPHVCKRRAFRPIYDSLPWRIDPDALTRWQQGTTGYPIVDAAMRQLRATGWMHNRCRMIAAMFLSKHLLIDWRLGEKHFMRHLIDGDLASNNGGWQWSASTGTDAQPYFRIFNPALQSRRFDARGSYIRMFVPELTALDDDAIHEPWASPLLAARSGYPQPIVDHAMARDRAVDAFERIRAIDAEAGEHASGPHER